MGKVILFDDYIDAHTLKRQIVRNIDFKNILLVRLEMELNGGFEYGIQKPSIKGGRYGELQRTNGDADFKPVSD